MADHERIWLQPECCADPHEGRQWCEEPDPADCDEGKPWTEYVRADLLAAAEARIAELEVNFKLATGTIESYDANWHKMLDANEDLKARIAELSERLEITHSWVSRDGKTMERVEHDPPLSPECDGISCRDETIRLQDEQIDKARARITALESALRWCGGSPDFNEGGQAYQGWLRICAPLLPEPPAERTEG